MYKFKCKIRNVFNIPFQLWMIKELQNVADWNPSMHWDGSVLICKGYWKIIASSSGIEVFSNTKFCTIRKGIRFNVEKGVMTIS